MNCPKCRGRMFVDRTFSENRNYEVFCLMCGERKFISKNTELGKWIHKNEVARENAATRIG